jgi:hypothetical protein
MRSFVIVLCLIAMAVFAFSDSCYCQEYITNALQARHRIVVVREDKDSVEVAPGEFVAFAGTQYYTDAMQTTRPETEKVSITIEGGCVYGALVFPMSSNDVSDDPSTWPLEGVNASSEGTAKVILSPKGGGKERVITITVKKYPDDWKDKIIAKLQETKVSVKFDKAAFEDVARSLSEKTGLKIDADYFAPEAKKTLITYTAENEPVSKILDNAVRKTALDWVLTNNRVIITSKGGAGLIRLVPVCEEALRWLYFHRSKDGSFSCANFMNECSSEPKCSGAGNADRDIAVTSLAILAFVGNGHTHRVGMFKKTVGKAKDYLLKCQKEDGSFGEMKGELGMLDSMTASWAICQLYAITPRDPNLEEPSKKALAFILKSQKDDGGWSWEKQGGKSNTVATAFAVFALKAASMGKIEVPKEAFDRAGKFFESLTDSEGKAGYEAKGDNKQPVGGEKFANLPVSTAASVIASILCGENKENERIKKGIDVIEKSLPQWDKHEMRNVDPVFWYFATYSVWQFGGEPWERWISKIIEVLSENQEQKGCATGSWSPDGRWQEFGGRVFSTALNLMTSGIVWVYARWQVPKQEKK